MYCFVLHIGIYLYCTNSKKMHKSRVCFKMQTRLDVESKHRTCASLCYLYNIDIFGTLLPTFDHITRFKEVSIEHLQRVRLGNRGRLLLWTPGPVPSGTCICFNVETNLSWTFFVSGI